MRGSALERFKAKCRFDATTGCVLWTGGTMAGQGNSARYGAFWFEGRCWAAHRWSGIYVHGLDLDGVEAGHTCNNTLCVQHIEPQTKADNVAERNSRVAQTNAVKQYWLFVSLGIEPAPQREADDPDAVPFYNPPEWLK